MKRNKLLKQTLLHLQILYLISNKAKYGEALSLIEQAYSASDATEKGANFLSEVGIRGTDVILFTYRANRMIEQLLGTEEC